MKKYRLEIILLITGAMIMILELVGSRILAPSFGTSLFVWTSLIGVILGSLSIGYWQGGKLADRESNHRILFALLLVSAIIVSVIAAFHENILTLTQTIVPDIRINSFFSALILFGPPNFFLGMISPYVVKLKLMHLKNSGQTVGNLYAISTLGSILGTFSAGFWLIPFFGTTKILLWLAVSAFILALLVIPKINFKNGFILILVLILLTISFIIGTKQANKLIETYYSTVKIIELKDSQTSRPIRALTVDPYSYESQIFIDGKDNDLVADYTKFYRLADYFGPGTDKTLMIGGCVFTYPQDFLNRHPSSQIDVVEIDPAMTDIAKKYFNFHENPQLKIINEDGRVFLNQNKNQYDSILIDAYNSITPPYNLTTIEAVKEIKQSLNNNGVIIVNLLGSMTGSNSQFVDAEYKTFSQVFPQVFLFLPTGIYPHPSAVQNIMMVAIKGNKQFSFESNDINENILLRSIWQEQIPDAPILTDDHAPVEYYLRNLPNSI